MNPCVEPAAKTGKRPPPASRSVQPKAAAASAAPAEKKTVKTCLVPSCGWPTDAELPARRSGAKR